MRAICFFLFLPLTFLFAGIAAGQIEPDYTPQRVWNTNPGETYYPYDKFFNFEVLGSEGGGGAAFNKHAFYPKIRKKVNNFYAAGGYLKSEHGLDIDRLWVNTDTFKTKTNIRSTVDFKINELTLQIGERSLDIITGKERFFGKDKGVTYLKLEEKTFSVDNTPVAKYDTGMSYVTPDKYSVNNVGTIGTADISGGTLYNGGTIDTLNYSGGNYEDVEGKGKIGTLNLAADSQGKSWGTVDNLNFFVGEGTGIINLTMTAFINEGKLGFEGVKVNDFIDFKNSKILLDMTDVINEMNMETMSLASTAQDASYWSSRFYTRFGNDALDLDKIFGTTEYRNSDALEIGISVGNNERITMYSSGILASGWEVPAGETTGSAPEPATLAVLSLGLTGLGIASRRRRRK